MLEISDRLEIQEVLANYSDAVDRHDWDLWDEVFTEDAVLDYTEISDHRGDRQSTKEWLQMMPTPGTYHRRRHRPVAHDLLQPDARS
jgi:3-phenylpropionate/cinnamic acid dioxygenase small subunit